MSNIDKSLLLVIFIVLGFRSAVLIRKQQPQRWSQASNQRKVRTQQVLLEAEAGQRTGAPSTVSRRWFRRQERRPWCRTAAVHLNACFRPLRRAAPAVSDISGRLKPATRPNKRSAAVVSPGPISITRCPLGELFLYYSYRGFHRQPHHSTCGSIMQKFRVYATEHCIYMK